MTPPPTNIDGTDITGATIDGQDVQEITIDGQTVFTAGPVIPDSALSQNLVAWYRFEDGDARDYTNDLDGTFADSTAYDGTISGATFQSSGGVTDFENGANSASFDFDGGDAIDIPNSILNSNSTDFTLNIWLEADDVSSLAGVFGNLFFGDSTGIGIFINSGDLFYRQRNADTSTSDVSTSISADTYFMATLAMDNQTMNAYLNGNLVGSTSTPTTTYEFDNRIGEQGGFGFDGVLDDARLYDKALTGAEISDIFNATQP